LVFRQKVNYVERKFMIKIREVLALAFAFALLTMSIAAQKAKAPAPDYFPLRVGDSWKYRSTVSDAEVTVKVVSVEKQSDGTMRYLLEKVAGVKIHDWYSKTNEWVLMHRETYPEHEGMEVKYEPAKQYLKSPLVAGATWNWKGKSITQNDVQESNQVIGLEMVEVPAGKFRAMKIVSQVSEGASLTKTYWYVEGVGLVKYTTESGPIRYGFELVDYSFKKETPKK
jgi:hypothetical protein